MERGAVPSWVALFILASGGAAARVLPGALKRGLGRGPDGPRRVFKDMPAQRRSQRRVWRGWATALPTYRPTALRYRHTAFSSREYHVAKNDALYGEQGAGLKRRDRRPNTLTPSPAHRPTPGRSEEGGGSASQSFSVIRGCYPFGPISS